MNSTYLQFLIAKCLLDQSDAVKFLPLYFMRALISLHGFYPPSSTHSLREFNHMAIMFSLHISYLLMSGVHVSYLSVKNWPGLEAVKTRAELDLLLVGEKLFEIHVSFFN